MAWEVNENAIPVGHLKMMGTPLLSIFGIKHDHGTMG